MVRTLSSFVGEYHSRNTESILIKYYVITRSVSDEVISFQNRIIVNILMK